MVNVKMNRIMKKTLLLFLLAAGMIACKKSGPLLYNTNSLSSVYFDFIDSTNMADSITYTFAFTPGKTVDTIYIPVRISGVRMNKDRQFGMAAMDSATTAVVKTHYAPLRTTYTLPAGQGS